MNGSWTEPGATIQVQVLGAPTLNTSVDANWTTIATATSSTTAVYRNGDPLYSWSTTIRPVPTAAFAARWPEGGLVKLRARGTDSTGTWGAYTFDAVTWIDCALTEYGNGTPGQTIGLNCQGLGRGVVSIVSALANPATAG